MAKHIFVWLIIAVVIMSLIQAINTSEHAGTTMDYTSFYNAVESDQVALVTVTNGRNIIGKTKSDASFNTTIPIYDENLIKTLKANEPSAVWYLAYRRTMAPDSSRT